MRFATFYDNSFRFPEEVEIGTRFETNLLCISFVLFIFFHVIIALRRAISSAEAERNKRARSRRQLTR